MWRYFMLAWHFLIVITTCVSRSRATTKKCFLNTVTIRTVFVLREELNKVMKDWETRMSLFINCSIFTFLTDVQYVLSANIPDIQTIRMIFFYKNISESKYFSDHDDHLFRFSNDIISRHLTVSNFPILGIW